MKSSVHQTGKEEPVDLRPAIEMDALPLEYKLQNGAACGNLDFTNFVNDPVRAGVCGIFGLSLEKQALDFLRVELRAVLDNPADSVLIGINRPDSFS